MTETWWRLCSLFLFPADGHFDVCVGFLLLFRSGWVWFDALPGHRGVFGLLLGVVSQGAKSETRTCKTSDTENVYPRMSSGITCGAVSAPRSVATPTARY